MFKLSKVVLVVVKIKRNGNDLVYVNAEVPQSPKATIQHSSFHILNFIVSIIIQIDAVDAIHVLVVDVLAHAGQDGTAHVVSVEIHNIFVRIFENRRHRHHDR